MIKSVANTHLKLVGLVDILFSKALEFGMYIYVGVARMCVHF